MKGIAGRSLLAVVLSVTVAGILWAVSLVAGPDEAPAAVPSPAAHLGDPLPPVAELRLGAAHVQPTDSAPAQPEQAQPEPAQDPLARRDRAARHPGANADRLRCG